MLLGILEGRGVCRQLRQVGKKSRPWQVAYQDPLGNCHTLVGFGHISCLNDICLLPSYNMYLRWEEQSPATQSQVAVYLS